MPTADTAARDYTAAETTAYEAYLSAVAEHNIVCARPAATTRDKMDAATAQMNAFSRFCEIAGFPNPSTRSPADIAKIESLNAEIGEINEAVRSAWSMLVAVDAMDVIQRIPAETRHHDEFQASFTLLSDAGVILRGILRKADGE
ncbi:hypothetical protein [Sphingobium cupriresistens]|uniref:Uncharacterized protein n=1 Tax=Sphingobium cupriresistens LL01 TaxID=1420583 RepID=A0A0J7Y4V6_9SPHN|nr:hypothetical protein [Sphingobium cupriresistens]KMS58692.1 hypothetical protein V473_02590 [Sphingobium cupriresistens LL01]